MSRSRRKTTPAVVQAKDNSAASPMAFTFGEPEPVLSNRMLFDYLLCWKNGRWYEPPLSLDGLARATKASVYLESGLKFKRNMLLKTFVPNAFLSRQAFEQLSLDFLTLGNGYLEARFNRLGGLLSLQAPLAKYMRVGIEDGSYFQVTNFQEPYEFANGSVFQVREADVHQEIYGLPDWVSSLQSALLNESATLFRRRYYENGSHAGFILYMSDPSHDQKDIDAMRTALKESKGVGNFKNLFMYSPNGKKDGIQVIPISEVSARDEFNNIKNITRDDILAALRIPPQLMGIVPTNAGGFGSIKDAAMVWAENELSPIQERFKQFNELIGREVIQFKDWVDIAKVS